MDNEHRSNAGGLALYIATDGMAHLRELDDLQRRFDPQADFGWSRSSPRFFSLDRGGIEITQFFEDVHIVRYEDALNATRAEPLVAYILSMTAVPIGPRRRAELQHFIESELQRHGVIHITKESGMFIGEKA